MMDRRIWRGDFDILLFNFLMVIWSCLSMDQALPLDLLDGWEDSKLIGQVRKNENIFLRSLAGVPGGRDRTLPWQKSA